jgi:hypothetical protein
VRQTLSLVLTFLMIQQTDAKTSHTKRNVPIIVRVGVAVAAIVIGIHAAKCAPLKLPLAKFKNTFFDREDLQYPSSDQAPKQACFACYGEASVFAPKLPS